MSTFPQAIAWTMVVALTGMAASAVMPAQAASMSPDPIDARAPTPAVLYQSPFAKVRRLNDATVGAWRQPSAKTQASQGEHGQHEDHPPSHQHGAASPSATAASDPHAGHTGH